MSTTIQCPRYTGCGANICPLDPEMAKRRHLKGEPICYYLRKAARNSATANSMDTPEADVKGVEDGEIWSRAYQTLFQLETPLFHSHLSHLGDLRRELSRVRKRQAITVLKRQAITVLKQPDVYRKKKKESTGTAKGINEHHCKGTRRQSEFS